MPRPRNPNALTPAQRAASMRARRGLRTVNLPAEALADAKRIRERDGDQSVTAAIIRVLRERAAR